MTLQSGLTRGGPAEQVLSSPEGGSKIWKEIFGFLAEIFYQVPSDSEG